MIVNGASRRSVGFWARHLANDKMNDRAELKEIRGLGATNLKDALLEMQEDARHTRCTNFFYQANFNPASNERLTEEQWQRVFEIFEKHRGIPAGQARVVYEHEKEGRVHRHVIWSRIDLESMKAWPDRLDAKVAHAASREISQELSLERAPSPYDKDREGERPKRAPKSYEMFRGLRSGLDPREVKAEVTRLYRESRDAAEFAENLRQHGYRLAKGDRRDFCIVDCAGDAHSLARRLDGVNAKQLRSFMKEIDRDALPTVEKARLQQRERNLADREAELGAVQREIAKEERDPQKSPRPKNGMSRRIESVLESVERDPARSKSKAKELAAGLESRGIAIARVTKDEAEQSQREAAFAKAIGRHALRFTEGEIVAVTGPRLEYRRHGEIVEPRRIFRLEPDAAAKFVAALHRGTQLKGIRATLDHLNVKAQERAAHWEKIRTKNATKIRGKVPPITWHNALKPLAPTFTAARVIGKVFDFAGDAVASIFAPELTPKQKIERDAKTEKDQAEHAANFSRYTAEIAGRQEEERETARVRAVERDR